MKSHTNVTVFLDTENYIRLRVLKGSWGEKSYSSTLNRLIAEKAQETEIDAIQSTHEIVRRIGSEIPPQS